MLMRGKPETACNLGNLKACSGTPRLRSMLLHERQQQHGGCMTWGCMTGE
jgi:hypothetical protein